MLGAKWHGWRVLLVGGFLSAVVSCGGDPGQEATKPGVSTRAQRGSAEGRGSSPQADCVPACQGVQCGPDGCGGSCGSCPPYHACDAQGVCFCNPDCQGVQCGPDGCGGSCGTCPAGSTCDVNTGQCMTCVPVCQGLQCGSDGCGGSCGACPAGQVCDQGQCAACIHGETRCATSNVLALRVCQNGQWTTQSCPSELGRFTMCSDGKCRPLCNRHLDGASQPAFCLSPRVDNAQAYLTSNTSRWVFGKTLEVAFENANQARPPILLDRALPWPGVWRLQCPEGLFLLSFKLSQFSLWHAPSRLIVRMGLRRSGLSTLTTLFELDYRRPSESVWSFVREVPASYTDFPSTLVPPQTGMLSRLGGFNVVSFSLSGANPGAPCDGVDLNWVYLEVDY